MAYSSPILPIQDVIRHRLVKAIIKAYDRYDQESGQGFGQIPRSTHNRYPKSNANGNRPAS